MVKHSQTLNICHRDSDLYDMNFYYSLKFIKVIQKQNPDVYWIFLALLPICKQFVNACELLI